MIIIYGIKNCDTVKRAQKWLTEQGVEYQFHDFRKDGLGRDQLVKWVDELGLDLVLNRRGTTWQKLPEDQKENLSGQAAIDLIMQNPAMIKRPLFDLGTMRRIGFSKKDQAELAILLAV